MGEFGRPPDDIVDGVRHLQAVRVAQHLPFLHYVPRSQHPIDPEVEVGPLRQAPVAHFVREIDEEQELLPEDPAPGVVAGQIVQHGVVHHAAKRTLASRKRHLLVHGIDNPARFGVRGGGLGVLPRYRPVDPSDARSLPFHDPEEFAHRPLDPFGRASPKEYRVAAGPEGIVDRSHFVPVPARIVFVGPRIEVHPQAADRPVAEHVARGDNMRGVPIALANFRRGSHFRRVSQNLRYSTADTLAALTLRRDDQHVLRQVRLQAEVLELGNLPVHDLDIVRLLLAPSCAASRSFGHCLHLEESPSTGRLGEIEKRKSLYITSRVRPVFCAIPMQSHVPERRTIVLSRGASDTETASSQVREGIRAVPPLQANFQKDRAIVLHGS